MATKTLACEKFEAAGISELRCVHCGEQDTLKLEIPTGALTCESCGEGIEYEQIEATIRGWQRLCKAMAAFALAAGEDD